MCGVCVEKGVSGRRQVLKETFGVEAKLELIVSRVGSYSVQNASLHMIRMIAAALGDRILEENREPNPMTSSPTERYR